MALKISFLLLTVALSFTQNEIMASATTGSEFNKNAAGFALDLYQHVIKGHESENVIMSPLSIHTALGLAYMGSAGKTQEEMAAGLRVGNNKQDAAERFRHVLCKYQNNTMLKIANKMYVQKGYELNDNFKETTKKNFKSEAENIDFKSNTAAAQAINSWVESKTNDKIKDLIDAGSLSDDTRMVLVNAIYFKGFWKHQFKVENTRKEDFWTSESASVKVDMMNIKEHFRYGRFEDLDATAIEMPYDNSDLSMLIILPNQRTGLAALEAKLGSVDLPALRKQMHSQEVIVNIPKFKIDFSIELSDVLKEMGMATMFDSRADFSGLLKSPEPLAVSKVVHKAFIEVNEQGAEAAAATAIQAVAFSAFIGRREVYFTANHPFLYILKSDNDAVFMGKYIKN